MVLALKRVVPAGLVFLNSIVPAVPPETIEKPFSLTLPAKITSAADGVGKMKKGGAVKSYKPGGSVKSGKPRGCGMASKGVRNAKMITMKGS